MLGRQCIKDATDPWVEPHGCFGPPVRFSTLPREEQERMAQWAIYITFSPPPDVTALSAAFKASIGPVETNTNRSLGMLADMLGSIPAPACEHCGCYQDGFRCCYCIKDAADPDGE